MSSEKVIAMVDGMDCAVEIMRIMQQQASIRMLRGDAALDVVAEAIEKQAADIRRRFEGTDA